MGRNGQLDYTCTSDTIAQMHYSDLRSLTAYALASGATRLNGTSFFTYEWDISGRCEKPTPVEHYAAPPATDRSRMIEVVPGAPAPLRLIIYTRCRKCDKCAAYRAYRWRTRADFEIARSNRTWFGTLTLRPEEQFLALSRARARAAAKGIEFESLSEDQQFAAHCNAISREVTLYLKRVRKESGAKIRYLIVYEAHKSGDPHLHLLVHEPYTGEVVGERTLRRQWRLGYSKFNLSNETQGNASNYVTKYLTKSTRARVRASVRYGTDVL